MNPRELAEIVRDPTFRRPHHGYANGCLCEACTARAEAFSEAMEDLLERYPVFEVRFAIAAKLSARR